MAYIDSRLDLVASQYPDNDSCLLERLDCLTDVLLKQVLNTS